jgi:hypothetical protein
MLYYPICPECGRTAEVSGDWVKAGFTGLLVTGLDFQNCPGCWDTMSQNGAAPGIFTPDGSGGYAFTPVPRPATEQETAAV